MGAKNNQTSEDKKKIVHMRECCKGHLRAHGFYHGSVDHGWEGCGGIYRDTELYTEKRKSLYAGSVLKCGDKTKEGEKIWKVNL
jgi:hypothetical protein